MNSTRVLALLALIFAATVVGCGSSNGGGTTAPPATIAPGIPLGTLPPGASFTHCMNTLNAMRAAEAPGAPLFVNSCAAYDTFAQNATDAFILTGAAHGYFIANNPLTVCVGTTLAAENQGWSTDPSDINAINAIFAAFLAEKALPPGDPARGHYETITNPALTKVSIGLRRNTRGEFYLTNDFNNGP